MAIVLVAVLLSGLPGVSAVSVEVPYSATGVPDADLDGNPGTGSWSDALSAAIPLENGEAEPYGSATLFAKHDGTYAYFRIDGSVDVPWSGVAGSYFWLGFEISPAGTSHHGGSGAWDGIYFGLWDGTDYAPEPTYPPAAVDTNGFGKPPAQDASQDASGVMRYSGASAPYGFTAEWKRALATGDGSDLAFVADGSTTYNFFVSTDSNGRGSAGGAIDHSAVTNLNTMRFAAPPGAAVHDVAVTAAGASPASVLQGQTVAVSATVENQGTVDESFDVTARAGALTIGTTSVAGLAAGGTQSLSWSWDTTGVAADSYAIQIEAAAVNGETHIADNTFSDGTVTVSAVVHDVAITAASASPLSATVGTSVTIRATSANAGTQAETFAVSAYVGSILVGVQTVSNLAAGATQSLSFTWDTASSASGSYPVKVEAAAVAGETNLGDNVYDDGTVVLIAPVHDVAVTSVTVNPAAGVVGDSFSIDVAVANQGTESETFDVTALANGLAIGTRSVTLAAGATSSLTFTWSTAGLGAGDYALSATASAVPGETDLADNAFSDGTVSLSAPLPETPHLALGRIWPEWRRSPVGTAQVFYAKVTNQGGVGAFARVVFDIYDKGTGAKVATVTSPIVWVPAGQVVADVAFASEPWTGAPGIYTVVGTLYYGIDAASLGTTDGAKQISRFVIL